MRAGGGGPCVIRVERGLLGLSNRAVNRWLTTPGFCSQTGVSVCPGVLPEPGSQTVSQEPWGLEGLSSAGILGYRPQGCLLPSLWGFLPSLNLAVSRKPGLSG